MADIYARTRVIEGSTADWTLNNLILGDGELAVERRAGGEIAIRVGDGVTPCLSCPLVGSAADLIRYVTPNGTITNIAEYLTDGHIVTVNRHGAGTGETAAINDSAFAAAIAESQDSPLDDGGGWIEIFQGAADLNFSIQSTIELPNRVKLRGEGSNVTRIRWAGVASPAGAVLEHGISDPDGWIYSAGIQGFEIDGANVANRGILIGAYNEACFAADIIVRRTLQECLRVTNGANNAADTYPNHLAKFDALHLLPQASAGMVMRAAHQCEIGFLTVNGSENVAPCTEGLSIGDYCIQTTVKKMHCEFVDIPVHVSGVNGLLKLDIGEIRCVGYLGSAATVPGKKNLLTTTLALAIPDAVAATMTIADGTKMPNAPFTMLCGTEQIRVTAINKATGVCTITRGYAGSVAAAHAAAAAIHLYGSVIFWNGNANGAGGVADYSIGHIRDDLTAKYDYAIADVRNGFYLSGAANTGPVRIVTSGALGATDLIAPVVKGGSTPTLRMVQTTTNGECRVMLENSAGNGVALTLDSANSQLEIANIVAGVIAGTNYLVMLRSTGLFTLSSLALSSPTLAAAATAGASGAPPAQVAGYLEISLSGTTRKIPYYAV